jgi:hypothetical protein
MRGIIAARADGIRHGCEPMEVEWDWISFLAGMLVMAFFVASVLVYEAMKKRQ